MIFKSVLLLNLFLAIAWGEIVAFDKTVLQRVYQQSSIAFYQDQIYIVYVHGNMHNFEVEAIFNSHCFGDKLCALLEVVQA